jgi:hypothetical protein
LRAQQRLAALCLLSSLFGCTTFPVIEADVCGNRVIEDREDCDTFAKKGQVCRAPGIVGECHFDCRLNPDGTRPECPEDTGCAADGICRRPTGEFDLGVNFASGVSSWLSTADFDGDGRLEVISTEATDELQQARFRVHYFDANAKLQERRTFPRVVTRPIVRQLTAAQGDRADDLIFSNDLIGMVPGRADREWVPASFSSYVLPGTRLMAVPVRADGVENALGLAIFTSLDDGPGIYVPTLDAQRLSRVGTLRRPFEELAGQPISAELVTSADSPCSEVVFAFLGDDSVHVLDLCKLGADSFDTEVRWRDTALEQIVHLPSGATVSAAPLTADVDGDGHLDLLVGSGVGPDARTFVALGDGKKLEDQASLLMLPALDNGIPFAVSTPLAAGDITGDGVVDFVLPTGVLASHRILLDGRLGYFPAYANPAQPWSVAVITDLNGNDLPDVIAGTQGVPGLSFLSGTGDPFQVATRLNTDGPLRLLSTGDFDGDRITDVAFVESGPPHSDADSLALAFGRRDGVPEDGRRIAEMVGVQQLGSASQAGVDSVFTVSKERAGGTTRSKFTLFDGSPDRLPFAPYSLVTFSVNGSLQAWAARVLAAGSFTAPGGNDLVVIGGNPDPMHVRDWSLWLVPDIGGGGEPPRRLVPDLIPDGALPLTINDVGGRLSATAAAADLEHDGYDEALLLMPQGADGCVLLIYDIDGAANTASSKGVVSFAEPCADPVLSTADLDGDGAVDLLALIGEPSATPRQLRLLFNDGNGGFSLEQSTLISIERHDVSGFSVFPPPVRSGNSRPVATSRIALVTDDGLYLARNQPHGHAFDNVTRLEDFADARSVVVTDPDGDGIEDIVVADAAGLWLVKAQLR